jgi:mitogen-activated protein kinase 15
MNTDLHHVIKKGNILKYIHVQFIMYQLFRAVQYLHSGNVVHRDLKPSNVLLDCECNCKVADFGLARSLALSNDLDEDDKCLTNYVATRWYRAPEILSGSQRYTKGVDMWSLGCILGELLIGKPLFPGKNTADQKEKIFHSKPIAQILERQIHYTVNSHVNNLLESMLNINPAERLTAEECMSHPFVSKFYCSRDAKIKRGAVVPPYDDNVKHTVDDYRRKLYQLITEHKRLS